MENQSFDTNLRVEKDFLGEVEIDANALFGIHSVRAQQNFPDVTPFHIEWYKSVALVKLACYNTYEKFKDSVNQKFSNKNIPINFISSEVIKALINAAIEVSEGKHFNHFVVPAVQGGAGTSINLNINEIITNIALQKLGSKPGNYNLIDPIEHANIFQSTNDVIPTSLKLTIMFLLNKLEEKINELRQIIEQTEQKSRNFLRIGYTQMQEAVPSSYGKLFSTYNEALSRDWWRVSKCFERIKVVNLGGSAIGTGISVPRFFIMEVNHELQRLTGLPVTRSENLQDATANLDSFVEVHAIIKAHAVNLEKMVSDLRMLSSDLVKDKEVIIPKKQIGSTIMPGKVNPVIPEFVISCAHKIYCNDTLITTLSAQGMLDLNAYLPVIGHSIIESIKLLIASNITIKENLFTGIFINDEIARKKLYMSPSITTALNPYIGYHKAGQLANEMKISNINIFEANDKLNFIDKEKLMQVLDIQNLLKTGFSISDL